MSVNVSVFIQYLPASLCRRDKAWSVNRLGRIARLHHQPDACVQIINTLYGFNAMEVQQAFVKVGNLICEHGACCLHGAAVVNA